MQPYDLPHTPVPPTWTSNGLHSLNTRPDLAAHRSEYEETLRLFPAQINAEQLIKPSQPIDKSPYLGQRKSVRVFTLNRTELYGDEPHRLLPTSPGLSDTEKTQPRKVDDDDLFEGDFEKVLAHTESSLQQTRTTQRDSWRRAISEKSIPPIGVHDSLLDMLHNESIVQEADQIDDNNLSFSSIEGPDGFGEGTGNPLTIANIGGENVVLCALSGLLDSAAVYDVSVRKEDEKVKHCVRRRGRYVPPGDVIVNDVSPVTEIVGSTWEKGSSEPCRAVFVTRRSLNFAHICVDEACPTIEWDDTLVFPDALSVALNPLYPAEFAAVCADGLIFGTAEEYASEKNISERCYDIQGLEQRVQYNRVCFGQHPRSVLLASRTKVASFDLRLRIGENPELVLFDVRQHWKLPQQDSGISALHMMQDRGYVALVATQSCLNFFDLRMPLLPLLDWSITLAKPIDQSCVSSIQTGEQRSELVALWSRRQCYLEVFHALHRDRPSRKLFDLDELGEVKRGAGGSANWKPPPIGKRSIVWSDLPLSHLQQLKGHSNISGLAFLPLADGKQVSLLQWSPSDGLMGQLLDIRTGDDTEEEFEADAVDGFTSENLLRMQKFQRRLVDCGEYNGLKWMEDPVSQSAPGCELMKRLKPNFMQDNVLVKEHVVNENDDDVNESRNMRFARPFLRNVWKIQEIRRQNGDMRTLADEEMRDVGENNTKEQVENEGKRWEVNMSEGENELKKEIASSNATTEEPNQDGHAVEETSGSQKENSEATGSVGVLTQAPIPRETDLSFSGIAEAISNPSSQSIDNQEESEMDGLLDEIGYGKTLDQIASIVRRGMPHNTTPLGVEGLRETVESSPNVKWRDVEWHAHCTEDHSRDILVATTKGTLPDWMHRRVYYAKEVPPPEEVLEDLEAAKESEFGQMVIRVKQLFFGDEDGALLSPMEMSAPSQTDPA